MAAPNVSSGFWGMSWLNSYLGRDFTWALSGNVVYSFCQWGFVVVLAKLGTPEDVGAYALGLAITSPILMFANFQGRNLVASDIRDEYSFGEYLGFRIASLALALFVVCGLIFFTQSSRPAGVIIFLVGLGQSFDYASETYFGLMQKHDRLDRVAQSLMLKGPLCLLLLSVVMLVTHNVLWAVAALAVGRGLILWRFDSRNAAMIAGSCRLIWKYTTQAKLWMTALPLGIISGLGALNFNLPRYFIEGDLSKRDLGIFSAVASLVGAGNLIMAALASCSIVGLARAWGARDIRKYRSLSLRLFAVSALLGGTGIFVAFIAGDRILTLLFRPEYGGSGGVFARIMLAGALGYLLSAQGNAMTSARKLLPQIPLLIATAVVTSLCSWWLVPMRGIQGAAEAWVLGLLFQLVFSTVILARMSGDAAPFPDWRSGTRTAPVNAD
jgi:O-antigen/teichoic acid export membrane protein